MTQEEKRSLSHRNLLWRCALSRRLSERIELVKEVSNRIEDLMDIPEKLIDKLTTASQTIQQQNEWIDCLYTAMQDDKNEIIEKAVLIQKGIEKYKKNKERFKE